MENQRKDMAEEKLHAANVVVLATPVVGLETYCPSFLHY